MAKPYRVLIVGTGSIGERHLRCFLATGRCEALICELNDTLREQVRQRYNLPIEYSVNRLEAAFDLQPTHVVICTPTHYHISQALSAVQLPAHLLIEKPLSVTTDGIEQLRQAVSDSGIHLSVAYVYRSHPALHSMKRAIESGRLGGIVQLVAVSGQHFPKYRPAYRTTYYKDHATGGGAVQDALTHLINAAEWLVGPITELTADVSHQVLPGVEVEDTAHVIARHQNLLAVYALNQHQAPNETVITVVGTHGTAKFEMHNHAWFACDTPGGPWVLQEQFSLERDDLFVRQANRFLDASESNQEPACSLAEARQTLLVTLAILESARSKNWLRIDSFTD